MWFYAAALQQAHNLSHDDVVTLLHWAVLCITSLLSILAGLGTFIVRKALKAAADKTTDALAKLDRIEQATTVATANHLAHIETESVKTNSLLEVVIKEQSETNGSIKTLVEILSNRAVS